MNNQSPKDETMPKFFLLPLVLCVVFFISIFDMPYGYYTFARVIVFVLSIIFLFMWYAAEGMEFSMKFIPVIIVAILWNPILPIYLDKETWVILDVLAIVTEIIVTLLAYSTIKNME